MIKLYHLSFNVKQYRVVPVVQRADTDTGEKKIRKSLAKSAVIYCIVKKLLIIYYNSLFVVLFYNLIAPVRPHVSQPANKKFRSFGQLVSVFMRPVVLRVFVIGSRLK
jgi:hypothetical protein